MEFFVPPCTIRGVVFSQPLGLWSFYSSSLHWTLKFVLVLVGFSSSSSRFLWQEGHLEASGGEFCYRSCRRWSVFGLNLFCYFDARSTLIHQLLRDTRHSDGSTGVFRFCRRLLRPWGSSVAGAWSSRAREVFSLSSVWRSRFAVFRLAKAVLGYRVADLLFGSSGGGACCTYAGLRQWQCLLPTTWVDFLLDVFVYSPVAMYSFTYVWLKFYWNFLC